MGTGRALDGRRVLPEISLHGDHAGRETHAGAMQSTRKNVALQADAQHHDQDAERDAEGDHRLRVDADGVLILGIEVSDQPGTRHQPAGVLAAAHTATGVAAGLNLSSSASALGIEWGRN